MIKFWRAFVRTIYAGQCPFCGRFLLEHGLVCVKCGRDNTRKLRLSVPFSGREDFSHADDFTSACLYGGRADIPLTRLKNAACADSAAFFASLLAQRLSGRTFDAVVPVPSGRAALRRRGYNPPALLARELSLLLEIPMYEKYLVKIKDGTMQKGGSAAQRRENAANAYNVKKPRPFRHVLLVDDVKTTGSTLDDCARALKTAGAETVTACAAVSVEYNMKGDTNESIQI